MWNLWPTEMLWTFIAVDKDLVSVVTYFSFAPNLQACLVICNQSALYIDIIDDIRPQTKNTKFT